MKVAVVGCGALGSYYGAKLAQAGHEVHFLLRSDYEVVCREGVVIRSPQGELHVRPHCAQQPGEIGTCDFVLIGLKTTANHQFPRLLPPLVSPRTVLLTLQNGLGNEEALAALFGPGQILGGVAFVCLNRLQPGLIHHMEYGAIVIGEFQAVPVQRTHQFGEMFRQAGVPCEVTPSLGQTHWEKLVWNIPFNGLGMAAAMGVETMLTESALPAGFKRSSALTTDKLLSHADWARLLRELMDEVVRAGQAEGYRVSESLPEKHLARTRTMGPYKPSTVLDFERGLPIELESLFLEPLRRAQKAKVPTPRLAALCRILQALDPGQNPGPVNRS